jgi:hypothetical protein
MDATDAIYLAARAAIVADSAAGGLYHASSSFYLRGGVRRESDPPRTEGRPFLRIEVIPTERSKERCRRQADALVRFRFVYDRDAQREGSESVPSLGTTRLHTVLAAGTAWGTQGAWSVGPGAIVSPGRYVFDGKESAMLVEYRVHADSSA